MATDWHVNQQNGDDGAAGSDVAPFKSLAFAVTQLSAVGDRIFCALDGATHEAVSATIAITQGGTTGSPIQIIATDNAWTPLTTGFYKLLVGAALARVIQFGSTGPVLLQGFEIDGNSQATDGVENGTADGSTVDRCKIYGCTNAVEGTNERTNIVHCSIYSCANGIITLGGDSYVGYNVIKDITSGDGVQSAGNGVVVEHNIIHNCNDKCVEFSSARECSLVSNILDGAGSDAVLVTTTSSGWLISIDNKFTNVGGYGINVNANSSVLSIRDAYYNNTSGETNGTLVERGKITMTDAGYNDLASDDFTPTDNEAYNNSVGIGADDSINVSYITAGALSPDAAGGGGGGTRSRSGTLLGIKRGAR